MILVCGGQSGVGKTEVSDIIQVALWEKYKIRSKIIHLDDYYKVHWQRRNGWRRERGLPAVGLTEIKWGMIKSIIKKFRNSQTLKIQQIHMYIDAIEKTLVSSRNIDILILEGVYANYLKKKGIVDLGIYLEGNVGDTYNFRKERAKENPDDTFRQKVLEKEAKTAKRTKKYADLVVPYTIGEKK
jgi:uridine kinase